MNAVFHYIKTLAIVHKSRCYNHLAYMKPKSEHNDDNVDRNEKNTNVHKATEQEKLKQ